MGHVTKKEGHFTKGVISHKGSFHTTDHVTQGIISQSDHFKLGIISHKG
jgi:hypothetical protein